MKEDGTQQIEEMCEMLGVSLYNVMIECPNCGEHRYVGCLDMNDAQKMAKILRGRGFGHCYSCGHNDTKQKAKVEIIKNNVKGEK